MSTTISPNMNLPVPTVGDEAGPQYAIDINACLNQIDAHNHTAGSGVQITPSGLNINADLPFSSNNATNLRSIRFTPQVSPITASSPDLGCAYVSGVDLYYNDVNGNQVRITQSGGIAGSPGSIANLTSPASASYVALSETFVWESDANVAASMDFRNAILRNSTANSFGLTLQPPTLASDYTLILPSIPGSNSFMTLSSSGVMGASISQSQGIVTSMIADNAITTPKIADANITLAKMASDSVDTAQIIDEAVTPVKLAPYVLNNSGASTVVSSPSYVDVASITLTVTGLRPVLVAMVNFNNAAAAGFISIFDAINPPVGMITLNRDGSDLSISEIANTVIGATMTIPASMFIVDTPTAGVKVYKIRAKVISSPTTNLTFQNINLVAYEL